MRSWWESTQLATSRRLACSRIRAPSSGWRLISVPLVRLEPAGLEQHRVRDPELADVVQHARDAHAHDVVGREPQLVRDQLGVAPDGLGVAGGRDVAQVERLRQQHGGRELLAAAVLGQRVEHRRASRRGGPRSGRGPAAWPRTALGWRRARAPRRPRRGGVSAMPTETEIGTGNSRNSSATARRRRSAMASASRSPTSVSTSANSSPPSRTATSSSRVRARSRSAKRRSTSSPAGCPSVSLTRLKWSRSQIDERHARPRRRRGPARTRGGCAAR